MLRFAFDFACLLSMHGDTVYSTRELGMLRCRCEKSKRSSNVVRNTTVANSRSIGDKREGATDSRGAQGFVRLPLL